MTDKQPQMLIKQTVYKGTGHKSWDGKFKIHSGENAIPQFANEVDSVYVLTEQEMKERDETTAIDFADWTVRNGIYMDVFNEWYHVPNGSSKLLAKTTKELYQIFLTNK